MTPPHRYIVTEIHDESIMPEVKVGTILRDHWRGKTHTYQIEIRGEVKTWATVKHVEKAPE